MGDSLTKCNTNSTGGYKQPSITSDIIVTFNDSILLIKRGKEPFKDKWALPGGFFDVDSDKTIKHGAIRELKEETNLDVYDPTFVGFYDRMDRDPRGRTVSFVWEYNIVPKAYRSQIEHYAELRRIKAMDDAIGVGWFPIDNLPELAFDHEEIIREWAKGKGV